MTYTALWQAYVEDQTTEQLLYQLAGEFETDKVEINKGSIATAIPELEKSGDISPLLIFECTNPDSTIKAINQLDEICFEDTRVITIGKPQDEAFHTALAENGVDSYLTLPIDQELLSQVVSSAAISIRNPAKKQTVMVLGARGGLGATTLATNLACTTANNFKSTTCLMDFDLHFGTVSYQLNQTPNHGLMTALERSLQLSLKKLLSLSQDYQQVIHTLTADLPLSYLSSINNQQAALTKLMDLAGQHYHSVIVDVGSSVRASQSAELLTHATQFVVVSAQTLLGLRDSERMINYLREIKPDAPITVMTNAWHPLYLPELSLKEFQNKISANVVELPYIKSANQYLVQHKPIALSKPNHAYCKALKTLAKQFQLTKQATKSISTWRELWGV